MLHRRCIQAVFLLSTLLLAAPASLAGDREWAVSLTLETIRTVSGGIDRDRANLGLIEASYEHRFGAEERQRIFLYGNGIFSDGPAPTELLGDIQGTSNIEAPGTAKLLEAWYERSWGGVNRHSLLFGLHDWNGEFDVLESAQLFRQSSFGLNAEIGQVPPSTFADTALGVRFRTAPSERTYLLAAIHDGVPGDPDDPYRTQIDLASEDGLFQSMEAGRTWRDGDGKVGVGAWNRTTDFIGADGLPYDGNRGFYLIAEDRLGAIAGLLLRGFVQAGTARRMRNDIDVYFGVGANLDDRYGIAVGTAQFSDGRDEETTVELTYRRTLRSWVDVQPDVQWVRNPGGGDALDDAVQLGVSVVLYWP